MAGGKTFKRDQKRRKEMARKLKQEEKAKRRAERLKDGKGTLDDMIDYEYDPRAEFDDDEDDEAAEGADETEEKA